MDDNHIEFTNDYFKRKATEHGFNIAQERSDGIAATKGKLSVIMSTETAQDGNRWLHVSLARPNKYPPYEEMVKIKEIFIGSDKKAIQVFPPKKNHVNIHKYCFHLWHCIDKDVLPDFDRGMGTI